MAWYRCGGNGSAKQTPQLIKYLPDLAVEQKSSFTPSSAFEMEKGDVLLVAVCHRNTTISASAGLTEYRRLAFNTGATPWYLSILTYTATQQENVQPTLTGSATNFLSSMWFHLRNANISIDDEIIQNTDSGNTQAIPISEQPFIFVFAHHYNVKIENMDTEPDYIFKNNNGQNSLLAAGINVGTNYATSTTIQSGATNTSRAVIVLNM